MDNDYQYLDKLDEGFLGTAKRDGSNPDEANENTTKHNSIFFPNLIFPLFLKGSDNTISYLDQSFRFSGPLENRNNYNI